MGCLTLIFPLLIFPIWAAVTDSITYVGPDTVVSFAVGSGKYEVAIEGEDALTGPYRLIATDSRLYLLDQFNNRVLCYDTAGTFVYETKTRIQPVDMAVDDSGLIYLLDNHSNPMVVVTYDTIKEVDRMEVKYEPPLQPHGLIIHYEHGLLFQYGTRLYRPSPLFDISGIFSCQPVVKKYRLDKEQDHTAELKRWYAHGDGYNFTSTAIGKEICRKDKHALSFLEDDTSTRIIVGSYYYSTMTGLRISIQVRLNDIPTILLGPISKDYFSYNEGWRNAYDKDWRSVSVDDAGNIYIFASVPDGKASILRWRHLP
jgi:hypothetical protein